MELQTITRAKARRILKSRQGELTALARRLEVALPSVTDVLTGRKNSARILSAAITRALELKAESEGKVSAKLAA